MERCKSCGLDFHRYRLLLTSSFVPCSHVPFQAKQLQDELTDVLGSSAGSNSTVDAIVDTSGRAIGGAAVLGVEGVESSALSCSSHSSSAVSENRCGGMVIIHDDGRNSNASEGGAYVEVRV